MNRHMVFVYGTLKTGEPNHYLLFDKTNGNAQFISKGKTIQKWPLVIASKYNIPYLIRCADLGNQIAGEIYAVDDNMLQFLDDFECHPTYYTRMEEKFLLSDGSQMSPWIYFLNDWQPHLLQLPTIEDYSSYGPHGLRYVERCERDNSNDGTFEKNNVTHEVKLFSQ